MASRGRGIRYFFDRTRPEDIMISLSCASLRGHCSGERSRSQRVSANSIVPRGNIIKAMSCFFSRLPLLGVDNRFIFIRSIGERHPATTPSPRSFSSTKKPPRGGETYEIIPCHAKSGGFGLALQNQRLHSIVSVKSSEV